jgi:hypothetical protein
MAFYYFGAFFAPNSLENRSVALLCKDFLASLRQKNHPKSIINLFLSTDLDLTVLKWKLRFPKMCLEQISYSS